MEVVLYPDRPATSLQSTGKTLYLLDSAVSKLSHKPLRRLDLKQQINDMNNNDMNDFWKPITKPKASAIHFLPYLPLLHKLVYKYVLTFDICFSLFVSFSCLYIHQSMTVGQSKLITGQHLV